MQPVSLNNVPYLPKEINIVEEKQDWNILISTIENNPELLLTEEGESLLFHAALQFAENSDLEAGKFLKKAFSLCKKNNIPIDINGSPSKGLHEGKSVFWLLSYRYFQAMCDQFSMSYCYNGSEEQVYLDNAKKGEDNIFSQNLLMKCRSFNCNVNAAPKDGPFKDVTAYCMLLFDAERIVHPAFHSQIICDSLLPQIPMNMPKVTVISSLLTIINLIQDLKDPDSMLENEKQCSDEEYTQILNNCYQSLFKIIEDNPTCDLDMVHQPSIISEEEFSSEGSSESSSSDDYHSFVEVIFSMPSSPNRDKLLLYYIFAGAKIPDTAKQEWKDNYNEILKKLNSVFDRVSIVCKYNELERPLPTELWVGIALNVILTEFPDLQNFSPLFLLDKFARGFK